MSSLFGMFKQPIPLGFEVNDTLLETFGKVFGKIQQYFSVSFRLGWLCIFLSLAYVGYLVWKKQRKSRKTH